MASAASRDGADAEGEGETAAGAGGEEGAESAAGSAAEKRSVKAEAMMLKRKEDAGVRMDGGMGSKGLDAGEAERGRGFFADGNGEMK